MPKRIEQAPPYWWFQGASVEELTRQLVAKPGCRLEVHLDGHLMSFFVVPVGGVIAEGGGGGIDDSHVCPPSCP